MYGPIKSDITSTTATVKEPIVSTISPSIQKKENLKLY